MIVMSPEVPLSFVGFASEFVAEKTHETFERDSETADACEQVNEPESSHTFPLLRRPSIKTTLVGRG